VAKKGAVKRFTEVCQASVCFHNSRIHITKSEFSAKERSKMNKMRGERESGKKQ
jgi:hypothetical protein